MCRPGGHHLDPLARGELTVHDADVGDHAAVDVVDRVEDHRARRGVGLPHRRGNVAADDVEQRLDALAGLGADPQHVVGVAADDVRDLGGVQVGLGGRQVDLVQHRDDLQVVLEGEIEIGQGLGLDALRGVDQQYRALAGGQAAANLVGEVDVARRVDHVQDMLDAGLAAGPRHPHVLRLDGDPALALDVHPVEVLGLGLTGVEHAGQAQHLVGEGRLAVIDVRDDREVADPARIRPAGGCHCVILPCHACRPAQLRCSHAGDRGALRKRPPTTRGAHLRVTSACRCPGSRSAGSATTASTSSSRRTAASATSTSSSRWWRRPRST